jgi:Zn-dependent peptidase ImmA (M78 family)
MLNTLAKLSRVGFNRHSLTLNDFYSLCAAEQITVLFEDVDSSFYMKVDDFKFIVLSKKLTAFATLYTAFHELAHAMIGRPEPVRACFFGLEESEEEQLANDFATIAIMPLRSVCNTEAFIETNEVSELAAQMFKRRVWIFENWGV